MIDDEETRLTEIQDPCQKEQETHEDNNIRFG